MRTQARRVRATVTLALAATSLLVATAAAAESNPRFTAPALADPDEPTPVHAYTDPAVVVDPDDPRHVFAASVELRSRQCAFFTSTDGGHRWQRATGSPSPQGYPYCDHNRGQISLSALAIGTDKTLYWAHNGHDDADGGGYQTSLSVLLSRSADSGRSWATTVVRNAKGLKGPELEGNVVSGVAVAPVGGQDMVYVAWQKAFINAPIASRPLLAVSPDGGRTFGAPVDVAAAFVDDPANMNSLPQDGKPKEHFGGRRPTLAVDRRGTVYLTWNLLSNLPAGQLAPLPSTYLSRSTDGGRTFTGRPVRSDRNPLLPIQGSVLRWSAQGGPDGSLHFVTESKVVPDQGDHDIVYQRSTDGGATWTAPQVVTDDDPRQLFGQYLPTLEVAPSGRLDLAWWDGRDAAAAGQYSVDVYYAYSSDNGTTWSKNLRVTDRSIDRTIGPWTNNNDMRQKPGVGSGDDLVVFAWDDTRNGNSLTETQDLYASAGQFRAFPLDRGTAGFADALAALAGMGVVGLAVIVAQRRRQRRSARAAKVPGPDPAPALLAGADS